MKRMALIGGIGSGKSTVSHILADEFGCYALDLDVVGTEVRGMPETITKLVQTFGDEIVGEDGTIIKQALAERAFASDEATAQLNVIFEEKITETAEKYLADAAATHDAAIIEISPYTGPDGIYGHLANYVIAVVAPAELRVKRAVARGGVEADVRRRVAQQITDERRCELADVVFKNDGTLDDLKNQVRSWWTACMTKGADA